MLCYSQPANVRYWTNHWQNRYWRDDINPEGEPLRGSGSNLHSKRGVAPGDCVYIVSILDGALLFGGKMIVDQIVSRREAVRKFKDDRLFDATEWVIGKQGSGTRLDLHRSLSPELAKELRFIATRRPPKGLFFVTGEKLDGQATRGVRELAPESAKLLDRIIEVTDRVPLTGTMRRIAGELLAASE